MSKIKKENTEEIISQMTSENHTSYIVEVKLKNGFILDKYDCPIYTHEEWSEWRLEKTKVADISQVQFHMEDDYQTPKLSSTMTYASAMSVAWSIVSQDKDRIFLVRVRPCRVDMSYKISKRDEKESIQIKVPS